jgi:hypothetical protein
MERHVAPVACVGALLAALSAGAARAQEASGGDLDENLSELRIRGRPIELRDELHPDRPGIVGLDQGETVYRGDLPIARGDLGMMEVDLEELRSRQLAIHGGARRVAAAAMAAPEEEVEEAPPGPVVALGAAETARTTAIGIVAAVAAALALMLRVFRARRCGALGVVPGANLPRPDGSRRRS